MSADNVAIYEIAGGHRPPLQFKLTHYRILARSVIDQAAYDESASAFQLTMTCTAVASAPATTGIRERISGSSVRDAEKITGALQPVAEAFRCRSSNVIRR